MNDYISKEAVIKKIAEVQDKATTGTEDVAYYRAIKIIRDEPAADVQPVKHGQWFHINNDSFIYCTECNNEAYWDTDYGQQLFDYCPYCGAKMIKGGKQNE